MVSPGGIVIFNIFKIVGGWYYGRLSYAWICRKLECIGCCLWMKRLSFHRVVTVVVIVAAVIAIVIVL